MVQRMNGFVPEGPTTVRMAFSLISRILIAAGVVAPVQLPGTRLQQNRYGLLVGVAGEVNASLWLRSVAFVGNEALQDMTLAAVLGLKGAK